MANSNQDTKAIDFIRNLPPEKAVQVLENLPFESLPNVLLVCSYWNSMIVNNPVIQKIMEKKIQTDPVWERFFTEQDWLKFMFITSGEAKQLILAERGIIPEVFNTLDQYTQNCFIHKFYVNLTRGIQAQVFRLWHNWSNIRFSLFGFLCNSAHGRTICAFYFDNEQVMTASADSTIKIWNKLGQCQNVLIGHEGAVTGIYFDKRFIYSCGADGTVKIWDVTTFSLLNTCPFHNDYIQAFKVKNQRMVTCSRDQHVIISDVKSPEEVVIYYDMVLAEGSPTAVDFNKDWVVVGTSDAKIYIINILLKQFSHYLKGHRTSVTSVVIKENFAISSSTKIFIHNIENCQLIRVIEDGVFVCRNGTDCLPDPTPISGLAINKKYLVCAKSELIQYWLLAELTAPAIDTKNLRHHYHRSRNGNVCHLEVNDFEVVASSYSDIVLSYNYYGH